MIALARLAAGHLAASFRLPLAWLQLSREPVRLIIAVAGVVFAVVLMFMQLGFSEALYASAVRFHRNLDADLVMISPHYPYLAASEQFSRRRLHQTLGYQGVKSVSEVYVEMAPWKNPFTGEPRKILVVGIDPGGTALALPGLSQHAPTLQLADVVLFDRGSRSEFGMATARLSANDPLETEVADRRIKVAGQFTLGASFAVDGHVVVGHVNFFRLLPHRREGLIDIGLIRLQPGTDPRTVRAVLAEDLPADVDILTKGEFIDREQEYWRLNTPIGYVFKFGVVMGLIVGTVIVYQVLFVNVADHLEEYATLKAIGFTDGYLMSVVLQQAILLAVLGYLPGSAACAWLYRLTATATRLPLHMSMETSLAILGLTVLMCSLSGVLALRKVRAADPAEVFA